MARSQVESMCDRSRVRCYSPKGNGDFAMTTALTPFGIVYLAVLISATAGCLLWLLQTVLSSDTVRAILTVLVVLGWLAFGYLYFHSG